ncbi:UNVERIFIED_CONTAM: hypothetical protein GTU68_032156 [Idotea baltica]|nr:hypothetical protein [Idotea baltica]
MKEKKDLRGQDLDQLQRILASYKEPAFRAKQVQSWLWAKGATDINQMTNLSKPLREKLSADFGMYPIQSDKIQHSNDGTVKFRFKLWDDSLIEAVLIPVPDDNRYTVCVSCQVGCSLSCAFCATGQMKRVRNLDPGEIYDQVKVVNEMCLERYDHGITNIVYMGMGEPLLTYKNVLKSIDHITSPYGMNMSNKRITISTAGIAKMIQKLADDQSKVNLALSLHAPDDEKRSEIMPINDQNNIAVLIKSLEYYYEKTKNRISFEYIALQDFNDSLQDADQLAKLCKSFPVSVNIIEYNAIPGIDFLKSSGNKIDAFAKRLRHHGVVATVRRSRGKDIDAACGQLANS